MDGECKVDVVEMADSQRLWQWMLVCLPVETDTYGGFTVMVEMVVEVEVVCVFFRLECHTHTHRQLIHNTNNRAPSVLEVEKEKERSGLRISEGRWVNR